jgi:NodT family efflux transporter outer membrane factor (OMF) lipoprotein
MTLDRHVIARTALCALCALSLGGWTVGPNYHPPASPVSGGWMEAPAATAAAASGAWWASFGDATLSRVVAEALARNLDLEQARARVLQARAAARAAGANLLPQGDLTAGAAHSSFSKRSAIGDLVSHLPGFERQTDDLALGAQASWETDLFGGLRRERQAAGARARASEADMAAVRVMVAADTADAYLQIRAYQARIAVRRRQEAVEADLITLVRSRSVQGVASDRELKQALAELEGVRAGLPPLIAGLEAQFNRLDLLMGAQPGTWRAMLATPGPIPAAPSLTGVGQRSDLLRQRPDVAAAEQRLIAANAGIGAAIAEHYPRVTISGLLGVDSISAPQLFTGAAVQNQIGAGLRWRLFDFGRIDAEVAGAKGRYAEALAAWRAVALRGAGEVETALSDLAQQEARARVLEAQIEDLSAARRQAEQAYESGVVSLIEVRDADRDLLAAADQLEATRAAAARAAVAAYRALGGGWNG